MLKSKIVTAILCALILASPVEAVPLRPSAPIDHPTLVPAAWGQSPEERRSTAAVAHIKTAYLRYKREVRECGTDPLLDCMAGAFDRFADKVATTPSTPNGFGPEGAPILRDVARSIRSAGSIPEARAAVVAALEPVSKSILLVRAGGDDLLTRQAVLQRTIVAAALSDADIRLAKAIGI